MLEVNIFGNREIMESFLGGFSDMMQIKTTRRGNFVPEGTVRGHLSLCSQQRGEPSLVETIFPRSEGKAGCMQIESKPWKAAGERR